MSSEQFRILCVEDDEDTRELLITLLGFSDLKAVAVRTAAEALRLMEAERFSLYVIDGQLPDAGGLSFCEQIRRVDKTTPVVFFTGKALEADREAGLLAGANAYVVKPDSSELIPTIKHLLSADAG
jgi:CheY-like chemotaxis protein